MKNENSRSLSRLWAVLALLAAGFGLTATAITSAEGNSSGSLTQQDVIRLENRMNQLEQRLYSIENNLRVFEQQLRITSSPSRGTNQQDWEVLRSEIQLLQNRLAEHECALAKLDERTLTPAMRTARKNSAPADRCRANYDTPLRLPD